MTLEEHYKKNYRRLLNIAYGWLGGNYQSAEDVVQETYYRALKYSDSYSEDLSAFDTWITTIFNRCVKDFKKAEREFSGYVELEEHHLVEDEDYLVNLGSVRNMVTEIEDLRPEARHIVYLYFIKGYAPREIVKVLDINNKKVRMTVHRFKQRMKLKYGEFYEEGGI
jgi:RNA polymerase sigma-70 factor (ECF subfamily)